MMLTHCSSLFHGFTFVYAQGTDLRTGTVAISCLRPTHSGVAQALLAQVLRHYDYFRLVPYFQVAVSEFSCFYNLQGGKAAYK